MLRNRLATFAIAAVAATAGLPGASASAAECANADALPADVGPRVAAQATLCLVNQRRAAHRAVALRGHRVLAKAANGHATDMVSQRYFSHSSPNGTDFVSRIARAAGARRPRPWALLGENLAWGSGPLATPRQIVQAWMDSPGHRANMLRRGFRFIGIAIVEGVPVDGAGVGATYATTFGTRF